MIVVLTLAALGTASRARAQDDRRIGVGVEVGQPTGLTLLLVSPRAFDLEFLAAWDFDNFLFVNAHALWRREVEDYRRLFAIYGPGAYLGFRDSRDEDVVLGVSGRFGAAYVFEPFEVYVQVTPRVDVVPETEFHVGGGFGFRFYL